MALPPPLLSFLLLPLAIVLLHSHVASSSSPPVRCRSGWTNSIETISPSRIDDGYCDCPYDGLDEPSTGACSGSSDGMWAGIPPKHEPSDYDAAKPSLAFACPQQPKLVLPPSRVGDGICDCCDGADENRTPSSEEAASSSSATVCADVCDEVLAEERAVRAKAAADYRVGSAKRNASVDEFRRWRAKTEEGLRKMSDVDLPRKELEAEGAGSALTDALVSMAKSWLGTANGLVATGSPLMEIFGDGDGDDDYTTMMSEDELASFVISLCLLSAEASPENVADDDDRCLALDRASLDVGILWDYDGYDNENAGGALPGFDRLDAAGSGEEGSLEDYAEKILLRLEEGEEDKKKKGRSAAPKKTGRASRKTEKDALPDQAAVLGGMTKEEMIEAWGPPPDDSEDDDSEDDPWGDDWEDRHDYPDDDDYVGDRDDDLSHEVKDEGAADPTTGEGGVGEKDPERELTPNELLVKSLLEKVPIDRGPFKTQANSLLDYSLQEPGGGSDDEETTEGDKGDDENDESALTASNVDPMAVQMIKSSISKRLSNIARGEACAKSAARYVASIVQKKNGDNSDIIGDLKNIAILTMYHGNIGMGDVAELVYTSSGRLRSSEAPASSGGSENDDVDSSSCSAPRSSAVMTCPPHPVHLPGGKTFPPTFITEAAQTRCKQREDSCANGGNACAAEGREDGTEEFPNAVPDGYYDYFEPVFRGAEDGLSPFFSGLDSLHVLPQNILDLKRQKESIDKEVKSLTQEMLDLKRELRDDSKYGMDGELYLLRDTCHKVESGKYEYELCVFGEATQRDIGQKSGGTNLGSWDAADIDEEGSRTLEWTKGTKCWNGPARSAEVSVACGAETRVLTSDEPETCKYVFTMESPIGCDERFKAKNGL